MAKKKKYDEEEDTGPTCALCGNPVDEDQKFVSITLNEGNYNKKGDWIDDVVENIEDYHVECFQARGGTSTDGLPPAAREVMDFLKDVVGKVDDITKRTGKKRDGIPLDRPPRTPRKPGEMSVEEARNILGVEEDAGEEDIKSAYKVKAKETHPDLNKSDKRAAQKFDKVRKAYEVLSG